MKICMEARKKKTYFWHEPKHGWWFQIFFIFTPTSGNNLFWLIFFRWVETTNRKKNYATSNQRVELLPLEASGARPSGHSGFGWLGWGGKECPPVGAFMFVVNLCSLPVANRAPGSNVYVYYVIHLFIYLFIYFIPNVFLIRDSYNVCPYQL